MIRNKMRCVVLLLFAVAVSAQAGTITLAFNQHATQNLFQTKDAVADQISAFSLALEKDMAALSVFANAEYSAFHQTAGLDFFAADIGLDYLVPSGSKSAFYFAAGGAGAFYSDYYAGFSTVGGGLTGAFKTYLAPSSILKVQWQGTYASYADSLFDYVSQVAVISIDKYFQTRTTLKADAEYGYKYFLHPFEPEAAGALMEPAGTVLMATGGGPGGPGGHDSGSGSGNGSGWGGSHYEGGSGFIPRTGEGGAGIGHVSASFLAAQGIGDVVGLSASAMRQWIVSGENPFMSIEEFYLVPNPTSDSFSWEGGQLTGRITLSLPWSIEIKTGYTYSDKTYPGVDSMDADGLPTGVVRNDIRHLFEARLEKNFRQFTVFLTYSHVDNASTDPLFVWSGGYIMAGFQWSLSAGRKGGRS
ncbi:MAG: hypothetical protein H6P95_1418 [Candidatus Aminicenantes bacterium]|nr:hypothetical protein [Candidatus Aminicenantes bacterium]